MKHGLCDESMHSQINFSVSVVLSGSRDDASNVISMSDPNESNEALVYKVIEYSL